MKKKTHNYLPKAKIHRCIVWTKHHWKSLTIDQHTQTLNKICNTKSSTIILMVPISQSRLKVNSFSYYWICQLCTLTTIVISTFSETASLNMVVEGAQFFTEINMLLGGAWFFTEYTSGGC